jgi:hypothetical protein
MSFLTGAVIGLVILAFVVQFIPRKQCSASPDSNAGAVAEDDDDPNRFSPDFNSATGLPMEDGIDSMGNPDGVDLSSTNASTSSLFDDD